MVCNSESPALCLETENRNQPKKTAWSPGGLLTCCITPDSSQTGTLRSSQARLQVCATLQTWLITQQLLIYNKVNQDFRKKSAHQ